MAIKTNLYAHGALTLLLTLGMLFSAGALQGQTVQPVPPNQVGPNQPAPSQPPRNDDITRRDIAEMDHYLDEHPEIAEQLRKDPSLIDNRRWVSDHASLQEFLQSHPQISATFRANPNLFMRDEQRYDRETSDRNISRRDIVEMDRFMDAHPEIAEQLKKDPSLIDNKQWVANHPALQEYLKTHIDVSAAFRAHPDQFMRDEDRYNRDGDQFGNNRMGADGRNDRDHELTGFGQFLGEHSRVAADLSNDPTLATNKEYLANHPELNDYLQAHPTVSAQLTANPQGVMNSTSVQSGSGFHAQPVGPTPKPKSPSNQ